MDINTWQHQHQIMEGCCIMEDSNGLLGMSTQRGVKDVAPAAAAAAALGAHNHLLLLLLPQVCCWSSCQAAHARTATAAAAAAAAALHLGGAWQQHSQGLAAAAAAANVPGHQPPESISKHHWGAGPETAGRHTETDRGQSHDVMTAAA
jgi:hypothetical protein